MTRLFAPAMWLGVAALALSAAQAPPATGLIVGKVVDSDGDPVARAHVSISGPVGWFYRSDGVSTHREVLTSDAGEFVFAKLPRGQYGFFVSKDGFERGQYGLTRPGDLAHWLNLADGERRTNVVITLLKFAAITGTVTDETGSPMTGITVAAGRLTTISGGLAQEPGAVRSARTDDRGVYRITQLEAGTYIVACLGLTQTVAAPSASGAATSRVIVYPQATFPPSAESTTPSMVSVQPGREVSNADFRLAPAPTSRVSGVVRGSPLVSPQSVTLRSREDDVLRYQVMPSQVQAPIQGDGTFAFEAVPRGDYVLLFSKAPPNPPGAAPGGVADPGWFGMTPVTVGDDEVKDVVLEVRPAPRISGRIEFSGKAARPSSQELRSGFGLELVPADGRWGPVTLKMLDDSRFVVLGAVPGRYFFATGPRDPWRLSTISWRGNDTSTTPIELGLTDTDEIVVRFTDRETVIRGVAADERGHLDEGAYVLIFPVDPRLWTNNGGGRGRFQMVLVWADGKFDTTVPPGDYGTIALVGGATRDWRLAENLAKLLPMAQRVTVREGDDKSVTLRTRSLK